MKKYQNNFYLFIIHVLIQKEHNRQQADDWLWDTIPNSRDLQGKSKPEVGLLRQDPPTLKSVSCLNKNGVLERRI